MGTVGNKGVCEREGAAAWFVGNRVFDWWHGVCVMWGRRWQGRAAVAGSFTGSGRSGGGPALVE